MDYLDNDTTNLILDKVPALDRVRLYKILNIPKPTQFSVSRELIASNGFRGNNGLFMRAYTTGEYEPCVQGMILLQEMYDILDHDYGNELEQFCRHFIKNLTLRQRAVFIYNHVQIRLPSTTYSDILSTYINYDMPGTCRLESSKH